MPEDDFEPEAIEEDDETGMEPGDPEDIGPDAPQVIAPTQLPPE